MSPVDDDDDRNQHLICVYNLDYLEKYQVNSTTVKPVSDFFPQIRESARGLRSLGILHHLDYKPDIFTLLGVYRGNPWGLRPTLYSSDVDRRSGRSSIRDAGTRREQGRRTGAPPLCRDGQECRFLRENACRFGHPEHGVGQLEK